MGRHFTGVLHGREGDGGRWKGIGGDKGGLDRREGEKKGEREGGKEGGRERGEKGGREGGKEG